MQNLEKKEAYYSVVAKSLNFPVGQSPDKTRLRLSASEAWFRDGASTRRSPRVLGGILVMGKGRLSGSPLR
jgi:hypothetical protein